MSTLFDVSEVFENEVLRRYHFNNAAGAKFVRRIFVRRDATSTVPTGFNAKIHSNRTAQPENMDGCSLKCVRRLEKPRGR
jgi:hypothetical protein